MTIFFCPEWIQKKVRKPIRKVDFFKQNSGITRSHQRISRLYRHLSNIFPHNLPHIQKCIRDQFLNIFHQHNQKRSYNYSKGRGITGLFSYTISIEHRWRHCQMWFIYIFFEFYSQTNSSAGVCAMRIARAAWRIGLLSRCAQRLCRPIAMLPKNPKNYTPI